MSKTFSPRHIDRCPMCHDGKRPEHIGYGVMLCECCGSRFRVVFATLNKTGKALGEYVKATVSFGANKGGEGR